MQKQPPKQHREIVRKLIEALDVPDCKCPIHRIHTPECDAKHKAHDQECNEAHARFCPYRQQRQKCQCVRNRCSCPFRPPADPDKRKCDCPLDWQHRCPHVQGAAHAMSLEQWTAFLRANAPEEYEEPPPPTEPIIHGDRAARVAALAARHSRGVGLWNRKYDRLEDDDVAQQCVKESGGKGHSLGEVRKG